MFRVIMYGAEVLEVGIDGKRYTFSGVPQSVYDKFRFMLSKNRGRAIKWLEGRVGKGVTHG